MKHNVERDLLHILKYKNDFGNINDTLREMISGIYKYENPYMNEISHKKMMIYLQKVLSLVMNKNISLNNNDIFKNISKLEDRLSKFKYGDLEKNKRINKQYNSLLSDKKNNKKLEKKIYSAVLGIFIITSLWIANNAKGENEENNENYIIIEEDYSKSVDFIYNEALEDNSKITNDNINKEEKIELLRVSDIVEDSNEYIEDNNDDISSLLEEYNLTKDEFNVLCAIVMAESKADSYEDAYNVINTIYNRTISERWVNYIDSICGDGCGHSLFYQATAPSQFVVYENGTYLDFLGETSGEKYNAILDFLVTKNISHNYLQFRSSDTYVDGSEQFTPDGNNYFDYLDDPILNLSK